MKRTLVAFGAIALASSFVAPLSAATPSVAYDQITKLAIGAAAAPSTPQPFASLDADALAETAAGGFPTVTGDLAPTVDTIGRFLRGVLVRKSFFGGNVRIDDPIAMRATISRPDKSLVVYLDLQAKTYRELDGAAAHDVLFPPAIALPAGMSDATPSPDAPSQTASAPAEANGETISFTHATEPIDGLTIDGVATHGTKTVATVSSSAATGSCPTLSMKITVTKYVDPSRSEPKPDALHNAALGSILKNLPTSTCRFTFKGVPATNAVAGTDDLLFPLFSQSLTETTVPALPTPIVGSLTIERGNVRSLSASDEGLFEIPAGFTKEQPAATPEPSPR